MAPLRVREDEDIAVRSDLAGVLVSLFVLFVDGLKIDHPAEEVVFEALRDEKVRLDHEVFVKSDDLFSGKKPEIRFKRTNSTVPPSGISSANSN